MLTRLRLHGIGSGRECSPHGAAMLDGLTFQFDDNPMRTALYKDALMNSSWI
jgi:hypothetical protein